MTAALALSIDNRLNYSAETVAAAKNIIAPGAPDHIIQLVLARCQTLGVDPLAKMIYAVNRKRGGGFANINCFVPECGKPLRKSKKDPEYYCWRAKGGCGATFPENDERIVAALAKGGDEEAGNDNWTLQSSIDFFRATAESSNGYAGQIGPHWCGEDGVWREIWLKKWGTPAAARVGIMRASFSQPLYTTAMFDEFAGMKKDGDQSVPTEMWAKMPALMLAKCAEALAIRRAFPAQLSGLYVAEEMDQADNEMHNVTPTETAPPSGAATVTNIDSKREPKPAAAPAPAPTATATTTTAEVNAERKTLTTKVANLLRIELGPKGRFKTPEDAVTVQNALQSVLGLSIGKPLKDYTNAELAEYVQLVSEAAAVDEQPETVGAAVDDDEPETPRSVRVPLSPTIQNELQKLIDTLSADDDRLQALAAEASRMSPDGITYDWRLLAVSEVLDFRAQLTSEGTQP